LEQKTGNRTFGLKLIGKMKEMLENEEKFVGFFGDLMEFWRNFKGKLKRNLEKTKKIVIRFDWFFGCFLGIQWTSWDS
jgi:hypothetical protein